MYRIGFVTFYALEASGSTYFDQFGSNGGSTRSVTKWVETLSSSVSPVMCHSHNDYLRQHPLFSAIAVGCSSIEADVWLSKDGKDLLVAHRSWHASPKRTLRSLYIDPLVQILSSMNPSSGAIPSNSSTISQPSGIFSSEPNVTLILFIDIKTDPAATWPVVLEQLKPLREKGFLSRHEKMSSTNQTFWPGPITVVGTGNILQQRDVNVGSSLEKWRQYHDVFLDAPLDQLTQPGFWVEENENEFYAASVSLWRTLGTVLFAFSTSQIRRMREQIQAANTRKLLSRYWELPRWPISRRNYVWRVLVEENIGLLNADDVAGAVPMHWTPNYLSDAIWVCGMTSLIFASSLTIFWFWKNRRGLWFSLK